MRILEAILRAPLLRATLAASASFGCAQVLGEPPTHAFSLGIRVNSDDGSPIANAEISSASQNLTTDASGQIQLTLEGREGDRRSFRVRCPKEFQSPVDPLVISLHQNAETAQHPVYAVTCVPFKRTIVVAIRTDGASDLPVFFLDEEVARTDAAGAAHFVVEAAPGEPFRVTLGTSDVDEDLRPIDPVREMSVGTSDDILIFEQKLTRVVRVEARPVRKKRDLPKRL